MSDPRILAVRSLSTLPAGAAEAISSQLLQPRGARCWAGAAAAGPRVVGGSPRALAAAIPLAPRPADGGAAAQADVLWVLCQLARAARDLRAEFAVELGATRGTVSTGGLDEGARALLAAARSIASRPAVARLAPPVEPGIGREEDRAGLAAAQGRARTRRAVAHAG
ncbi:MAG: hypothetical protein NVSMB23_26040 [Myxococcales bacterium]